MYLERRGSQKLALFCLAVSFAQCPRHHPFTPVVLASHGLDFTLRAIDRVQTAIAKRRRPATLILTSQGRTDALRTPNVIAASDKNDNAEISEISAG
jgi:hypothetical protein